jgi:predicted dehydrogenase
MPSKTSNSTRSIRRRDFFKAAGVGAAVAAFGLPQFVPRRAMGDGKNGSANERITLAVIGVGGRGSELLRCMVGRMERGEVNIAAISDVDGKRLEKALETAGPQAAAYPDYRSILERKDIDAVMLATPNHWHGVQSAQAAECGKHLYCETPACSTIDEGKAMIAAAKRANIAVQIGAQGRSQPELYLLRHFLENGAIGKIARVDCWCAPSPIDERPAADGDPPSELDYDLWLGPLRWRPYNPRFSHGNFRWSLESGGGQLADRGSHLLSCVLWCLSTDGTAPTTIEASGTSPTKGLWDAAVEMDVAYTFKKPDWTLTWNQPGEPAEMEPGNPEEPKAAPPICGAVFRGESGEARLWGGNGSVWIEQKVRDWVLPADRAEIIVYRSPGHFDDWFRGIKTGERTIANVDAAVGVANLCNLGNLAFLLDRKIEWSPSKGEIVGDEEARRLMGRPQRFPYAL